VEGKKEKGNKQLLAFAVRAVLTHRVVCLEMDFFSLVLIFTWIDVEIVTVLGTVM
jgi:hypothetical protein